MFVWGYTTMFSPKSLLCFTVALWACVQLVRAQDLVDISPLPDVFESRILPYDDQGNFLSRYMGSVGNGHVSTTVYSDTVYVNLLYNGNKGDSHRARVPSAISVNISLPDTEPTQFETHALRVRDGIFESVWTTPHLNISQRTFAHRYYTRALITQITVDRVTSDTSPPVVLGLSVNTGPPSVDLNLNPPEDVPEVPGSKMQCGTTKEVEHEVFQPNPSAICVYWTEVPSEVEIYVNVQTTLLTYVMVVDQNRDVAEREFADVMNFVNSGNSLQLLSQHITEWNKLWEQGEILVEGSLELDKAIHGCLYYQLSSLPSHNTYQPNNPFGGLSPGGLAYGDHLMDYQGHSFWDTEMWMFPTLLLLYPELGKDILSYRLARINTARDRAVQSGYAGIRFPWESAFTGSEVTPDCCPEIRDNEQHITAGVSFAIRQLIGVTRDLDWLQNIQGDNELNGCNVIHQIAAFWASRVVFNETTRLYDIRGVMSPDEDHLSVDNSVYTNVVAGLSLYYARYASCLCQGSMDEVPENWSEIAKGLTLLFDSERNYHPGYEGYEIGTVIKQADAVLLPFPLMYPMDPEVQRNDLEIYEPVTREDGPAMTWAIHAIGFADLGDFDTAEIFYNRSYQDYTHQPYRIWTEKIVPILGATNFISAMGGFLEATVFGYGGIRLHLEEMTISPHLPPQTTQLDIKGIKYLGNVMNIRVTADNFQITVVSASSEHQLEATQGTQTFQLYPSGSQVTFTLNPTTVRSTTATNCQLPEDIIGQPISSIRARQR